jgi:hypothetical protein
MREFPGAFTVRELMGLDVRDFKMWVHDARIARLNRLEDRLDYPVTNVPIDFKNYEKLKSFFETERYFEKNPDERERLRRESQC